MFIITKTFTDDEGHLFTKVNPKQYSTPGEAYDAMREDYLNELKSRGLDSCGVKFELDGGDRIMVEDELRQDALSVFDEYDIDAEEV